DNDGSLDLMALVTFYTNGYTALFRNITNSFLADSNAPGSFVGGIGAWGDYNNDGSLDFAISGYPIYDCCGISWRVYRNDHGILRNVGATLPGAVLGAVT